MYTKYVLLLCACYYIVIGDFQVYSRNLQGNKDFPAHVKYPTIVDSSLYSGLLDTHNRKKRKVENNNGVAVVKINNIHDSHPGWMVHWVGGKSGVVICFAKDPEIKIPAFNKTSYSTVFVSYDDGDNYENKTESFKMPDGNYATLDKLYYHPNNRTHLLFTDVRHNFIFLTKDHGKTFEAQELNFTPNEVSFHETNPSTFVVFDKNDINHQLWATGDFGKTFRLAMKSVEYFYWLKDVDENYQLLVHKVESDNSSSVIYSDNLFRSGEHIHSTGVKYIFSMGDYLFTTKFNAEGNLTLYASYKLGKQLLCVFNSTEKFLNYFVVDVTDSRIVIAASNSNISSTLYVSENLGGINGEIRFNSSLENVFSNFPSTVFLNTSLNWTSNQAFVDVHKVKGLTGIYIASKIISKPGNNLLESVNLKTLITFDYGATWRPIAAPQTDSAGQSTDCLLSNNCSLHLTQISNELSPAMNIFSSEYAPGIIMSSGSLLESMESPYGYGLYISRDAGLTWYQTLQGQYYYKIGDHGGLIVAVEKCKNDVGTTHIKYSTDEGEHWERIKIHDEGLKIFELLTESEENSIFTMLGTLPATQFEWIIVKIDLRSIINRTCSELDYEMWSPSRLSEGRSSIPCTLGQQTSYERRLPHANCMYGTDFVRNISKQSCDCDVFDYECDSGFVSTGSPHRCILAEPLNTYDPYKIPSDCKPGQFYNRTKGYRKISGNVCVDNFEYHYMPDIIPCPSKEVEDFFLLANRNNISRYNLVTRRLEELPIKNVIAFDFDMSSNCLYFAEYVNHTIRRQCLNNDDSEETLLSTNLSSVEGIALDWISKSLYFVDGNRKTIELIKTNVNHSGRMRKTILNSTVLDRPRGIALHLQAGYMFWTDWSINNPSVSRANLDGTENKVLFGKDEVQWPNGITIDHIANRIYWIDARKKYIGSSDLHGDGFLKVVPDSEFISHPFAIAVFKNDLYWDDWNKKSILRADKDNFKSVDVILERMFRPMDLKVFTHGMQIGTNKCSNSSCPYICVGLPKNNFACLCPDGLIMRDQMCMCPDEGHFECRNNRCIPVRWRCDGADDCGDSSDEEQCPKPTCPASSFVCDQNKCIPNMWRCDNDYDCNDHSDEMECSKSNCTADQFSCENGRCISMRWKCDGENDCIDKSDEKNCTPNCTRNEFQCKSGSCIPLIWKCDAENDCNDNSDELDCLNNSCNDGFVPCGPTGHKCIRETRICDGIKDCITGEDEVNCTITTMESPKTTTTEASPKTTTELLNTMKTITEIPRTTPMNPPNASTATESSNTTLTADSPKTTNATELLNTMKTTTEYPKTTTATESSKTTIKVRSLSGPCKDWMFLCKNQRCVPFWWKCDGIDDCGDGSDEIDCTN